MCNDHRLLPNAAGGWGRFELLSGSSSESLWGFGGEAPGSSDNHFYCTGQKKLFFIYLNLTDRVQLFYVQLLLCPSTFFWGQVEYQIILCNFGIIKTTVRLHHETITLKC